jgi:gag-polypeptide of LTR copia-type/Integrase core domain
MPDNTATSAQPKYAFKHLPKFDPVHSRAWASDVKIAFAERNWNDYLVISTAETASTSASTSSKLDELIVTQSKAFILQAIPYEYRYGLEEYETAAEIFHALEQKYNSQSRHDELRLESMLMDMKKQSNQSIDQHIANFSALMASLLAQQRPGHKFDNEKRNQYFVRTLENADTPNENWLNFVTYIGDRWHSMTPESLHAEARSWYESKIKPALKRVEESSDTRVLSVNSGSTGSPFKSSDSSRFGKQHTKPFSKSKQFEKRPELPSNPDGWCDYHRRIGHTTEQCQAKLKDPDYLKYIGRQKPSTPKTRTIAVRVYRANIDNAVVWIYDTACTQSMTDQFHYLHDYTEFQKPIRVYGVGKNVLHALGSGNVLLQSSPTSSVHIFKTVWYVPELGESIISKHWTRENGLITSLDENENFILSSSDPTSNFRVVTQSVNQMTVLPSLTAIPNTQAKAHAITASCESSATIESQSSDVNPSPSEPTSESVSDVQSSATRLRSSNSDSNRDLLMHERLLHPSSERLAQLGIKFVPGSCKPCILGKQTRTPFKPIEDKATEKLAIVHMDHCGPVNPITYGNGKYALNLKDQATGYAWSYIVPDKSASTTLKIIQKWLPQAERQSGNQLKIIRTDDAREFKGVLEDFLEKRGIEHETAAPYSSSSNGVIERVNRTLFDMVRPMLIRSKLPTPFWGEALSTATKVLNRLPSKSNPDGKSPHELWFGQKPSIAHLRQFGCLAYARIGSVTT